MLCIDLGVNGVYPQPGGKKTRPLNGKYFQEEVSTVLDAKNQKTFGDLTESVLGP